MHIASLQFIIISYSNNKQHGSGLGTSSRLVFRLYVSQTKISLMANSGGPHLATFGAGCFWGVQRYFKKQFGNALINIKVGYSGGTASNALTNYEAVCTGKTGHAEAIQIEYDPSKTDYDSLVTYFFRIHDPTTKNRQGNDNGSQYRSVVFYHSEGQKGITESVMEKVKIHFKNPIVTEIVPATTFILAEDYHQDYLDKNPGGYCNHKLYW